MEVDHQEDGSDELLPGENFRCRPPTLQYWSPWDIKGMERLRTPPSTQGLCLFFCLPFYGPTFDKLRLFGWRTPETHDLLSEGPSWTFILLCKLQYGGDRVRGSHGQWRVSPEVVAVPWDLLYGLALAYHPAGQDQV